MTVQLLAILTVLSALVASILFGFSVYRRQTNRQRDRKVEELKRQLEELECQLEDQKRFMNAVLDSVQVAIVACNEKGEINLFNKSALELHGKLDQSTPHEHWASHYQLYNTRGELLTTDELPLFQAWKGQTVSDKEVLLKRDCCPPRLQIVSGTPLVDASGQNLGGIVVMHDLTALTESCQHYHQILETANEAFIETDSVGCITEWNKRAELMFGWTRAEALNRNFARIVVPERFRDIHQRSIARCRRAQRTHEPDKPFESTVMNREGLEFRVELSTWFTEGPDGTRLNAFLRELTEAMRAGELLKKSEKINCQIIDFNPDCIKILSLTGHLLSMSAGGCRAMDLSCPDEVIGRWWPELWPIESRKLAETAVDGALQGSDSSFEAFCPTSKGTPKWWDVRVTAITNENGVPERILSISRDITDRKAAESIIEKTRRCLDLALRGAQIGTFTWDLLTNIRTWDEHCPPLFGLPRQPMSLTPEQYGRLVHPDDLAAVQEQVSKALKTGQYKAEYRVIWPDGSIHVISAWGEVAFMDNKPVQMAGVAWNITARKQAEQALRSGEARLREAQEIAHLGYWEFQTATQTLSWSQEMFRIFGLSETENITYHLYQALLPAEDRRRVLATLQSAIHSGQSYELTHLIRRPDGSVRHVDVRGRAEFGPDNQVTKMTGTLLDVTARVEAAVALQRSHELLESRVQERTAQLGVSYRALQDSSNALQRTEARYRSLLEQSPLAIHIFDITGLTVAVNPAFEKLFGTTASQMRGYNILKDPQSFLDGTRDLLLRTFAGEVTTTPPTRHDVLTSVGSAPCLWIQITAYPLKDSSGQVQEAVLLLRDVTERQNAIEALRRSESEFRQLADSMPQIVWTAKPDGTIEYYNERWYSFTGMDRNLVGDPSWELILHPDDLQYCRDRWYSAVRTHSLYDIEYRFWDRQSKAYRWHLGRALPIKDADGAVVRWFGSCTDIDDSKKAEQELSRTQARLQAVLDSATKVSIIAVDNDGMITLFNSGAERLLGYTAHEVVGKSTPAIFHLPEHLARYARDLSAEHQRAISIDDVFRSDCQSSGSLVTESVYVHRDGTRIDVNLAVTPKTSLSGERIGTLAIAVDVTDRKALELQLGTNNLELQQQTRRAEEANRAKSDFLAAMSHEIRTPMNAILGMSDLLWESELDSTQKKYVEVFRRAGANLLTLVNDILDLSKIESGHFELERIDFDLEDLVERTIEMVRPKTQAKRIDLISRITPGTPYNLVGDPTRLQQILLNLLGNAVKFTENGQIAMTVSTEVSDLSRVHFEVSDTGIGIKNDKLESIFDDFTQAETSTTRRFGGTGLGLGIARRLITLMGGQLLVASEFGKGSTFSFHAVFGLSSQEKLRRPDQITNLVGRRVLVVDNNPTNRLIFSEMCARWGMIPSECASADTALTTLRAPESDQGFDLAILDRLMPGMDSFAFVSSVRNMGITTPILMTTSDNLPGDETKSQQLGIAGYAVKPVRRSELLRLVCQALGTTDAVGSSEDQQPPFTPMKAADPSASTDSRARILIAEDSEDNRFVLQAYLKDAPYYVTFVQNGKEAADVFRSQAFDLVLMDMHMPIMDGLAATKLIRDTEHELGRTPVPVLALTANARQEDIKASNQVGCNSHLSKPISKPKLLSTIGEYILKTEPIECQAISTSKALQLKLPEGLEDAAKLYIQSKKAEIPQLVNLAENKEFEQLRTLAHNIKGVGESFGFPDLTRLGGLLENSAKEQDLPALSDHLLELSKYVYAAVEAVAEMPS